MKLTTQSFKKYFPFLIFLVLILAGARSNSQNAPSGPTVIMGATLIDGTGEKIENGVLIISNGRIEAVGDETIDIPANSEILDFSGKYITPGLIDAHVHFSSTGFFDTRPNLVDLREHISYIEAKAYQRSHPERYYDTYLRSGVTGVYDVGGPPWTIQLQESAENDPYAPHIAATGTLITNAPQKFLTVINPPVEKEMIRLSSEAQAREVVQYNTGLGSTGIKVLGLALDNEEYLDHIKAVADEAHKSGNKLLIHANSLQEAKAALRLGAEVLVHGVRDTLVDDEFVQLLNRHEAIYVPTMSTRHGNLRLLKAMLGQKMILDDPNGVIDSRTKTRIEEAGRFRNLLDTTRLKAMARMLERSSVEIDSIGSANLKKLFNAGAIIAVGTDAGVPGLFHGVSIHEELERMQEAGIPADELIIMATRNGAMAMERLQDFGTLEVGKMADLIILEEDPSKDIGNLRTITHVARSGLLRPVSKNLNSN